ncbi:penicillin acylase family protein [Olivibacter ginsenosidimutans]|uniref:Penicillin acylase family protein n=1 Tax=Olivibacter ginsenosidimutans TaxID=1176537 RepID=A0ABP9BMS3_9SPHI
MKLRAFISTIVCIGLAVILNIKIGDIPPLGKFLNPFTGFWRNAEPLNRVTTNENLRLRLLHDSVNILYDEQHIPHIIANNDYDLYFAQGYVTAKDRLWQMDFQTRYASGRLAEVIGEKAIPLDKYQRRMGMAYGAEKMLQESLKDSISRLINEAYTDGVNAYIQHLQPKDYPLEFKLLDYAPEPWKPINAALLLKLMSATLAGGSDELYLSNVLATYGADSTLNFFSNHSYRADPIIPKGTPWAFKPLPISQKVGTNTIDTTKKGSASMAFIDQNTLLTGKKEEGLGSNNWAISAEKSMSGKPILANDPHLSLTLPSIWYQIQLKNKQSNSYGVSIPGAPCIIIGFNQHIAWGVTNVGSDVLDWYHLQFKDNQKDHYLYNNQWLKTTKRIETINVRGSNTVYDTVYYTHHGPISALGLPKDQRAGLMDNVPENAALKWVAHLPSNDLRTFYALDRAKNYEDYRQALTYFTAPAQNFIYADNRDTIAITPNGYFPLKWPEQGKFILDGSAAEDEWKGRIPAEQNPHVKNPERGFVSSANQSSTDESYPYYLNWEFASYDRGHRINQKLNVMKQANIDSLRLMQLDNHSVLADELVDTLIQLVAKSDTLTKPIQQAFELVKNWDHCYDKESIAATIFDSWYAHIIDTIWSPIFSGKSLEMRFPNRDRTVHLLLDEPNSPLFDSRKSATTNGRSALITNTFFASIRELTKKYGTIGTSWRWGAVHQRNVPHLASIPGLGSASFFPSGSPNTINAIGAKSGPSWRMVVQLGEKPRGYGILPGGSSGNPGSPFYSNQLPYWVNGELQELLFITDDHSVNERIKSRLVLTSKAKP